jgi:hypothetical protein
VLFLLACTAAPPADTPLSGTTPKDSPAPDDTADSGPVGDTGDSATAVDSGDSETVDTGDSATTTPSFGPCADWADAVPVATVVDPALDELSGLVVSRQNPGIFWTHEDSAGAAALYALDTLGDTVATLELEGVVNEDWEDLALSPCDAGWCLVVGDIGDLGAGRTDFSLLVVPEPLLDGTPLLSAVPEVRPFTYPSGAEDAESLAVLDDGTPLLVSKRMDASAGIYTLPVGDTVLTHHADIATGGADEGLLAATTAADLSGTTLLLRTYFHLYTLDIADLAAPGPLVDVPYALELQGEAVAFDPAQGGFWQVAEGANPTLWYTGCAS